MDKLLITLAAFGMFLSAHAQTSQGTHTTHLAPSASTPAAAASSALTAGEVRRVDVAQKKVTLRHGPIASLDMPAMTMVFQVADAQVLSNLVVGNKVRFAVEKQQGAIVVTTLEEAAE